MKYTIISGFLFLSTLICFGQSDISFSVGLRNHSGGLGSLNRIIRQYNDSRDWLSNNLNEQRMQNGFEIGLEKSGEEFGVAALKYF